MPERDCGINHGRAPGRNVAGQQCHGDQQCGKDEERHCIQTDHAEHGLHHQLAHGQRAKQSHDKTDRGEFCGLPQNHEENVAGAGPDRHANADLMSALFNRMCHHAIDSNGREQQRQIAEYDHGARANTHPRHLFVDDCVHALDIEHRLFLVHS